MDWWTGIQKLDIKDSSYEYQVHLDAIRENIPKDLLMMQEAMPLHDARLREMDYTVTSKALNIRLDGDDGKGGLRQYYLRYSNVVSFYTSANPGKGLPGPHGYGDWGYDEVDVADDGRTEHRILFSSGIEFQTVFGEFKLSWNDTDLTSRSASI